MCACDWSQYLKLESDPAWRKSAQHCGKLKEKKTLVNAFARLSSSFEAWFGFAFFRNYAYESEFYVDRRKGIL